MRDPQDTPLPSSFWTLSRILNLSRTALLVLASAWLVQLSFSPKAAYLVSNVRNLYRPIQYHGAAITADFFEGWYFKMVKTGKTKDDPIQSMAIIPGIHHPSPDNSDQGHAFVIVVGLPGPESAAYFRFPISDFTDLRESTQGDSNKGAFKVQIGNSFFSHDELVLNLPANRFDRVPARELEEFYTEASRQYEVQRRKTNSSTLSDNQDYFRQLFPSADTLTEAETHGPFAVRGHFLFPASSHTPLPTSRWTPSIMGITAYLPFLECNHGVASLHHTISKGHLVALRGDNEVLGEAKFDGGVGYIEKDWGVNFPSTWVWAQANMFDTAPGSSLMISVASIPVLGPDFSDWVAANVPFLSRFTNVPGRLVIFYHAATKTLYNFSSYVFSARAKSLRTSLDIEGGTQTFSFMATTGDPNNPKETIALQVNVTREIGTGVPLRSPSRVKGRMFSGVEEAVVATTDLKLWRVGSGEVIVEDQSLGSGLEVVGDIAWLEAHINH
ncbi:hypothetical protein BGZ96_001707 [Linnemannia gamsii]|uniref:Uncharacterized protein n=1 Tax=Linnemannia gamsii TaxID=64522 RepID=A0ABQ7JM10_9FUNG|nr:hypothetical protein BGZ96_001707 [Linnemannia gamsii]